MRTTTAASRLAQAVPGTWTLGATSLLFWLDRRHGDPIFTFELASASPLRFTESVAFETLAGRPKVVRGTSRLRRDEFAWRGTGVESALARRWSVRGADAAGDVLCVSYRENRIMPGGLTVLVREGAEVEELRTRIACDAEEYGISAEEFASLTWLR